MRFEFFALSTGPWVQHDDLTRISWFRSDHLFLFLVETSVPHQQAISVLRARCRRRARLPPGSRMETKEHFHIFPITIPAALFLTLFHVATTLQPVSSRTSNASVFCSILSVGCLGRSSQAVQALR